MYTSIKNNIKLFHFNQWKNSTVIKHAVTTRHGGVSIGKYYALNLGNKCGDNRIHQKENISILNETLGVTQVYLPDQCHTANIKTVDSKTTQNNLYETDALITSTPGICIGVLTADCVPVLIADPYTGVIAAIHAGWRGIINGIVSKTIEKMLTEWGCQAENINAGIGPSISQKNYQVGPEVVQAISSLFSCTNKILSPVDENGHAYLNLWEAIKNQLISLGIKTSNIEMANICTFENPELFYSARRDGFHTGRFGSFIMLA